ncbi:B12-binding domain-containing protein [Botrimarina hoheduenensis]|uniref:Helix-turn-helix domain protein n=1 Tax=Botrimarina hoheduenensis TaxID=2528000 RepID=A0A5C5WFC0_9BACT|nr:B12-binding domain-containing protein [Botrimarina hoheduenensis]TWT48775.1 Helix-turn-helix domain protein [Botrimarina hoheduenensis]
MKELLSPKQVATSIGVSESSLKRWCDQGVISTERTPGGHRRIRLGEVLRFLREQQHPLTQPEVLGLPVGTGTGPRSIEKAREPLLSFLSEGKPEQARRVLIDLFLAGNTLVRICEELITPVLYEVGDNWQCGRLEIYQEHRACEILNRVLYDLRAILPPPEPGSLRAMGGTPVGDNYRLATLMVELVLVDAGWNATSLGSSLPFETLISAANKHQPELFWLSYSNVDDAAQQTTELAEFLAATPASMQVVIGGQQLPRELPASPRLHPCQSLRELRQVISQLRSS